MSSVAPFAIAWVAAVVTVALLADRVNIGGHFLRAEAAALAPVLVAIGALAVAAMAAAGRRRALLTAFTVLAVLLTAGLDTPLDLIPHTIRTISAGNPLYATVHAGLRPRELEGMIWIRDHLDHGSVLAVSNDRTPQTRPLAPVDNDFPAFTEDPTFREGWVYTARSNEIGETKVGFGQVDPFPARTALERAVFIRGDRQALEEMIRKYGVTDIVVSKKDGAVNPRVYRYGRLIYSNPALDVIAVSNTKGAH